MASIKRPSQIVADRKLLPDRDHELIKQLYRGCFLVMFSCNVLWSAQGNALWGLYLVTELNSRLLLGLGNCTSGCKTLNLKSDGLKSFSWEKVKLVKQVCGLAC